MTPQGARRAALIEAAEMCERQAAHHKDVADEAFAHGHVALGSQHVDRASEDRTIAALLREMAEAAKP